jgi:hypothetical protein
MLWSSGDFRYWGQMLVDLARRSEEFTGVAFHIHHGYERYMTGRGPSSRNDLRPALVAPAAVATWLDDDQRASCAVRVAHVPGAHPADALGEVTWARFAAALAGCGIDYRPEGRALRFEHGHRPDWRRYEREPRPSIWQSPWRCWSTPVRSTRRSVKTRS